MAVFLSAFLALGLAASDPDLSAAEAAFQEARYEDVLPAVSRVLAKPLPAQDHVRAHELAAMTHAAFGDSAAAVASFVEALKLNPRFAPPLHTGPKLRAFYDQARQQVPAPAVTALSPSTPSPTPSTTAMTSASTPLYRKWWFWAGIVVVGAAATAGGAALAGGQAPRGTLGQERFP